MAQEEPYIGTIELWPCRWAPNGWAFCDGSEMKINDHPNLFQIIGTQFGGDGVSTFKLPDFRGRIPVGSCDYPIYPPKKIGETGGFETNDIGTEHIPPHSHSFSANKNTIGNELKSSPENNFIAQNQDGSPNFALTGEVNMNLNMLGAAGGNIPITNMMPCQALNFIIALNGVLPPLQ